MKPCAICKLPIQPGTATVSIVGGQFPVGDPDFFMIDDTILVESYVHRDCLVKSFSVTVEGESRQDNS